MNAAARIIAWLLAVVIVTLPVVGVLQGWFANSRWPVRHVELTAEFARVNAEQVAQVVRNHAANGIFALDVSAVQHSLAALPWVSEADVQRRFPDRLAITLVEHRAVARLGTNRLLSDTGDVFDAPGAGGVQGLPMLDAAPAQASKAFELHQRAAALVAPIGLAIARTEISTRGALAFDLTQGGRVVLGRTDSLASLARLVRVAPAALGSAGEPFGRIDLRYAHGFAVLPPEVARRLDQEAQAPAAPPLAHAIPSPGRGGRPST